MKIVIAILMAVAPLADDGAVKTKAEKLEVDELRFDVPSAWESRPPSSTMRKAQFSLPAKEGDAAEVVIYFFPQGAGTVDANLDRWCGQVVGEGGRKPTVAEHRTTRTIAGMPVHILDISGRLVAETRPGSGVRLNKTDQRLIGVIIEASKGSYFIKALGPGTTVAQHHKAFNAFLDSMTVASAKPKVSG